MTTKKILAVIILILTTIDITLSVARIVKVKKQEDEA